MPTLVPSFLQLLQPFQSQMTTPTFASLLTVLAGWVLCRRRHTVTGALDAVGHGKHFCAYHRLFAAARWDVEAVGLALAGLILAVLASSAGGVVFLVIDDTLCRKRGRKLFGAGMHYDAQLTGRRWSNANRSVKSRGHCWVVLGVVVGFPFCPGHYYCLPVLSRLYLNGDAALRHRRAYRTKPQLALELLGKLCAAFPGRRFHLLADSAYGGRNLLGELPANCSFTCRWILNAALYAPAPARPAAGAKARRRRHARGPMRAPGPGPVRPAGKQLPRLARPGLPLPRAAGRAADGRRLRAAERFGQTAAGHAGGLLHDRRGRDAGAGAGVVREAVEHRGDDPRRQAGTGSGPAAGPRRTRGAPPRADAAADVLAGRAVVRPVRPPPLAPAASRVVPGQASRELRRHADGVAAAGAA
jgi:hypothetical protein